MYEKIPKIINLLFSMFNSVGKGVNTNYRLVYPRFQFCEGKTGEKMFVRFRFVSVGKDVMTSHYLNYPRFQFCEGKTGEKMFVKF